ncbi:drug/metabolite transporter (DMT) superfamily, permease [Haloferula helveola]|uniref:Drug/metabolite transporter (DMT) superfamily, permease n=1 Tax=Haloferula helveola TaxID=490095 RepID=A0ABN6H0F1_9BACT|nr:drug/metabolite transporter (DMT) superfamily, permease [Haloferula helveola]
MKPLLQLHLLVFLVATTAIVGRLSTVSAANLVTWRTGTAAIAAFLWVALVRRHRIPTSRIPTLLGIGGIIGLHWLCFFGAIQLANISICLAGMATISLFTAFTEPLFERRRVRPFEVLLGLVVVAGILLIAGLERAHWAGLGVGLLGALFAAIFPVLNRQLVTRGGDPLGMVAWEMVGACLTCLLLFPLFDPRGHAALLDLTAIDWAGVMWLSLVCTVFGHAFHIHLLRDIKAYPANLAMNVEPVWGILFGALFFAEYAELHPGFYLGVTAIIAANLAHPWLERKARHPQLPAPKGS